MTISASKTGDIVTLVVSGRIDTSNCAQLQEAILNAFTTNKYLKLQFSDVAYISSAGLRALLIGQKTARSKGGYMRLFDVSRPVMQIFETVGFDSVLDLRKTEEVDENGK